VDVHKQYFHVYDGPRSWLAKFTHAVYRPDMVVIDYDGDETKAVDLLCGNE